MSPIRKTLAGVALVATTFLGGAVGAAVFGGSFANAQTATPTPAPGAGSSTATPNKHGNGTFTPNEDPAHEAGESAAREAQENAGQAQPAG